MPTQEQFRDYAIDQFNAGTVIQQLVFPRNLFPFRQPILFAGLCAWVIANKEIAFIHSAMVLKITGIVTNQQRKIEARLGPNPFDNPWAKPALARLSIAADPKLRKLHDLVLEPLGGFEASARGLSAAQVAQYRRQQARTVWTVVVLMRIFHLHRDIDATAWRKPINLEFASKLAMELLGQTEKRLSLITIRNRWNAVHASAPLIYTASLIKSGDRSLLDRLCDEPPKYSKGLVFRWFRLARSISREILEECKFPPNQQKLLLNFPTLQRAILPSPELKLCHAQWLVKRFQEEKVSFSDLARTIPDCKLAPSSKTRADNTNTAPNRVACRACASFSGRFDQAFNPIPRRGDHAAVNPTF
jgi:hypothetical protein